VTGTGGGSRAVEKGGLGVADRRRPKGDAGSGAGEEESRGAGRWPKGSIATAAAEVLRRAGGPLTLDALADGLSGEWRLGDGWRQRLRGALRQHVAVCRVGTSTYDLLARRLSGARLRHVLTAAELRHGLLLAEPDLDDLLFWWEANSVRAGTVEWIDADGRPRAARIAWLMGPEPAGRDSGSASHGDRIYRVLVGLGDWLRDQGARAGDEVCVSPEAPEARRFRLSLVRDGTDEAAVGTADAAVAAAALDILREAGTVVTPRNLLGRLAGRLALDAGPGVHLPVFVLGLDERFAFDGVFYAPRALAEAMAWRRISSPYPRPDDYTADWPRRDPMEAMAQYAASMLPESVWGCGVLDGDDDGLGDAGSDRAAGSAPAQVAAEAARRMAERRAIIWDLLQDRSRLLNPAARPATGARPLRGTGKVIVGPWRR
jgi:hypothetical protein